MRPYTLTRRENKGEIYVMYSNAGTDTGSGSEKNHFGSTTLDTWEVVADTPGRRVEAMVHLDVCVVVGLLSSFYIWSVVIFIANHLSSTQVV
jgi:hypothetical protein